MDGYLNLHFNCFTYFVSEQYESGVSSQEEDLVSSVFPPCSCGLPNGALVSSHSTKIFWLIGGLDVSACLGVSSVTVLSSAQRLWLNGKWKIDQWCHTICYNFLLSVLSVFFNCSLVLLEGIRSTRSIITNRLFLCKCSPVPNTICSISRLDWTAYCLRVNSLNSLLHSNQSLSYFRLSKFPSCAHTLKYALSLCTTIIEE